MSEYKLPTRTQISNKGTFGKVLNFAGSKNYIGAAYLSSLAVLKSGAGYVAIATEKDIIKSVSTMLPEAVYLSRKDGIKTLKNYDVVLIGCGLGTTNTSAKLLKDVVCNTNVPLIIDADGLNVLSKIKLNVSEKAVITPHPAEASRLLNTSLDFVLEDLERAAKMLVDKYSCTVVLKSHRTIICDRDNYFVNMHGNSALAKAGTGDVLAGIIAGLAAQKMPLFEAAKLGVYLHSRAGEIASEELSEYSVLASELLKYLPKAILEII